MLMQSILTFKTGGRGFTNVTADVIDCVSASKITTGLCHVFLHHTSASLILCENVDPQVQRDLEAFMLRLIPDADPLYKHIAEGPDDMPAHVRNILTQSFLVIPVTNGKLALGTWQGVYLWEHRMNSHERKITVTVSGN